MEHPSLPTQVQPHAVKATVALSYIPCILFTLDDDSREMFASVMQALLDAGYENGFNDGLRSAPHVLK